MSDKDLTRLEHQIRRLLRVGVVLTAAALTGGLVLFFAGMSAATFLLDAGLILLMAIPVARIVASLADSIRRRDRLLVWSTTFVLIVMAATLIKSLM